MRDDIFAHIVELVHIEQRARDAHFFEIEGEGAARCVRIAFAPFLVIAVCNRHQIFEHALGGISLLGIKAHGGLGILSLGEFSFAAAVLFHDGADMGVFWGLEAEQAEQLQVFGHRG